MTKTAKGGKANTNFWDIFKISFVASMGALASFIVVLLIAAAFAVPGYFMVLSEKKAKKAGKERNTAKLVFGWILIAIGAIIALPFIIDILVWRGLDELT